MKSTAARWDSALLIFTVLSPCISKHCTAACCTVSGGPSMIKWWYVTTATANNSFTSLLPPQLFVVTRILDNEWLIIWAPKNWQIYNTDDQKTAENISNVENISVSRAAHRYMCRPGADCGRGMGRAGRDNQNTAAAWREREVVSR